MAVRRLYGHPRRTAHRNFRTPANRCSSSNLVTVIEPDPTANPVKSPQNPPQAYPVTSVPTGYLLTSYTYDQLNHLTQVSMPRSTGTQTRSFAYTSTGYTTLNLHALWLTSATNPENGTVSYTYNADGTLATKTDANNNIETYSYDTYQRLIAIPDRGQTFTYDTCPANDTFCTSNAGQLVEATFGSGVGPNSLSFQYDYTYTPAGKVAGKSLTLQSANNRSEGGVEASGTLTASYTYDNQGALTSMVYPTVENWAISPAQTFTYTLDAMERPTAVAQNYPTNYTWVSGVTYNAANQTSYGGRLYNNLLQLTAAGAMTYTYSANKNNSQITSSFDTATNETITYGYDALKRLSSAASSNQNWGETYTYDGFGNMTQMQPSGTGGAPSLSMSVNAATNQLTATGVSYDNNGNLLTGFGGMSFSHDAANRVSQVETSSGTSYYGYDSGNRRIYYRNTSGAETIYFYGADGKKLATYTYTIITYNGDPEIRLNQQSENVYFTGILVSAEGGPTATDRLGSVTYNSAGNQRYYPYGAEYSTYANTPNDTEKYATYTRDSVSGMDYAVNRYYSSQWGRFLSPDPHGGSVSLGNPQSWNRYSYAGADPANSNDPSGLFLRAPGQPGFDSGSDPTCQDAMDFWNAVGPLGVIGSPPTDPFTQSMSACLGTNFIPWGTALGGAGGGASAGSSRDVAVDAAMRASDLIESPDCAGMFLSPSANTAEQRQMLSEQLQYVADSGDLRMISPNALPQGTSPNVPAFTTGTWGFIYVVSGSAFFTNTTPTGQSLGGAFQGLTLSQTQELIVVHEFLHWEGVGPDNAGQTYILPNGDKVTGSQGISNEVRKKCFK